MKKITQEQFEEDIHQWGKGEYKTAGEYKGSGSYVEFTHIACGKTYKGTRDNFKQGRRCPDCFGKRAVTTTIFKDDVFEQAGAEYSVQGTYVNAQTKINMLHTTCQTHYKVTPNKFLSGKRCPKCNGSHKKTTKEYIEEIKSIHKENFTVLGAYTGANDHIRVKHNACGNIFYTYPNNLKRIIGCGACGIVSKGEERIKNYLKSKNVSFTQQQSFQDCRHIYPLPFDFSVQAIQGMILVEYDGIQHYTPVEAFGGEESFLKVKRNDRIKTMYCKHQGIPLIRIGYDDYENIEKILKSVLEEYNGTDNR